MRVSIAANDPLTNLAIATVDRARRNTNPNSRIVVVDDRSAPISVQGPEGISKPLVEFRPHRAAGRPNAA